MSLISMKKLLSEITFYEKLLSKYFHAVKTTCKISLDSLS